MNIPIVFNMFVNISNSVKCSLLKRGLVFSYLSYMDTSLTHLSFGSLVGRVVKVVKLKSFSSHRCRFEFHLGCQIILCEEVGRGANDLKSAALPTEALYILLKV